MLARGMSAPSGTSLMRGWRQAPDLNVRAASEGGVEVEDLLELELFSEEELAAREEKRERNRAIAKVLLALMMGSMMLTWVGKNFFIALL